MVKKISVMFYLVHIDIGECLNGAHNCSQECLCGKFECDCFPGYELQEDEVICEGWYTLLCVFTYIIIINVYRY